MQQLAGIGICSHGGVMRVQAVEQVDAAAAFFQHRRNREQPHGPYPQVIGGKVVNPGIYQQYEWSRPCYT